VKERFYSLLKGTVLSFPVVNGLIAFLLQFSYPDFFHVGLLFRPQTLVLIVPLSALFFLDIKYIGEYLEESETDIDEWFEEVTPDFGN